ncbi:hypothetical protein QUF56_12180 [Ureibacillus composti]|nr:hypothetical protein [Ureibacillus composti]
MVNKVYGGNPEKAMLDAFPEKERLILRQQKKAGLKEEILALVPAAYKSEKIRKEIAEKVIAYLDCEEHEIPKNIFDLRYSVCNLNDYLESYYDSSAFRMIEEVRPGAFKPWEFDRRYYPFNGLSPSLRYHSNEVPEEYFEKKENRFDAIIWLFEKLRENGKKVRDLDVKSIFDYGLFSLMNYYDRSVFLMIDEFFEGQTKPWEFRERCSNEYWITHNDVAKEGILFLIDKLGLTKDTITQLTLKDFEDNYLDIMLYANYNGLIFSAIDSVYPNEFAHLKWLFQDIPEKVFLIKENRLFIAK